MLRRRRSRQLEQLARRLEDLEDTVAAALDPHGVDDVAARVDELSIAAVTHDDLLRVRTELARLTADVTRVRAELHAELDRIAEAVDTAGSGEPFRRRAAG